MRIIAGVLIAASGLFAQQQLPVPGQRPMPASPHFGSIIGTTPPVNKIARPPGTVLPPPPIAAPHGRHGRQAVVPYPVFYGGYYGYTEPPQAYTPEAVENPQGPGYDQ